jgi:hypothetical protein
MRATAMFNFFKEIFCAVDMITDIDIFGDLVKLHPAWATLTIFSVLSPFFVIYIPFIHFLAKGEQA